LIQAASDTGNADALVFFMFDLLYLDGNAISSAPLLERKERLRGLLSGSTRRRGASFAVSHRARERYRLKRASLWDTLGGAATGSETLDPASTCLARLVLEPSMSTASVANKIGGISLQDGSSFRNGRNCRGGVADVLVQVVAGPGPYGSYCGWGVPKAAKNQGRCGVADWGLT
jgi:hypothetical protein